MPGRVDGIFGPQTAAALTDFQRNAGLTTDGVFGPDVLDVLGRVGGRTGTTTKAGVQERIDLRSSPRNVAGRRVVVAESGAMPALANALGRALDDAGAASLVVHHPDGSAQAAEANRFEADVFIGLGLRDEPGSRLAYYATTGFESSGGRRLAELAHAELERLGVPPSCEVGPMRLPVLRETRMPALLCEVGPVRWLVEHNADVATSLARARGRVVRRAHRRRPGLTPRGPRPSSPQPFSHNLDHRLWKALRAPQERLEVLLLPPLPGRAGGPRPTSRAPRSSPDRCARGPPSWRSRSRPCPAWPPSRR